jgi:hypothetical protein
MKNVAEWIFVIAFLAVYEQIEAKSVNMLNENNV